MIILMIVMKMKKIIIWNDNDVIMKILINV